MRESVPVAVVGAGPAGLATSHELAALGVDHLVLERGRVGETWRGRWDTFRLVTPNWSILLPGGEYRGDDPDGFMPRDEIVSHLAAYAASFDAPVIEGVTVTSVDRAADGSFRLGTTKGKLAAGAVVLASGAYQRPHRPAAATVPADIVQLDAEGYTNEGALPPGKVLVVGSGQTGCQIAEELCLAGREVFLACGRTPWAPRRFGGHDLFCWSELAGVLDDALADLPSPAARLMANGQASGHAGGHDLHFRTLQELGVTLVGRFLGAEDGEARFADDLADSVAFGDARYGDLRDRVAKACATRGIPVPEMPLPSPFVATGPTGINLAGVGAVIFTCGFRPDYSSWVRLDAFDTTGFPIQEEGASTVVPGLYFCGVHFLRKRKSSLLAGVGEDAAIVARAIAERATRRIA